jgi:hypothetical protein
MAGSASISEDVGFPSAIRFPSSSYTDDRTQQVWTGSAGSHREPHAPPSSAALAAAYTSSSEL